MKIRPVGAELFHADGQTDGHEAYSRFRNFTNVRTYKDHLTQISCKDLLKMK